MSDEGLGSYKAAQRRAWEAGDYRRVAARVEPAALALVRAAGVAAGHRVLDVATGSGSVAIAAAQMGAEVVGVDHTDAWFDDARGRAAAAGVDVELRIGDAEALPADDDSFDRVLSSLGVIFAPRHDVVAAELVRTCRPGGVVGLTAWTPDGPGAAIFTAFGDFMPDPPPFATAFIRWGDRDHLQALFAPHGVTLDIAEASMVWAFTDLDDFEVFLLTYSGPFIAARDRLVELGRWDEALAALRTASAEANEATDGTARFTFDYLIVTGAVPA